MNSAPFRGRRVHLVGIGGAGVSALVPLLRHAGARVDGCDAATSATIAQLVADGVPVSKGHHPRHVAACDLVVHSAAVPSAHPELEAARAQGIEVISRGECLARLMLGARTLAIAGSHGKTSTTWMAGHLLTRAGADPVVMVGGAVGSLGGGGGRAGSGGIFVAETDESDGSFARVEPEVAVLTNLDHEHLRHYGSYAALEDAFNLWLRSIPAHGACIVPVCGLGERVLAGLRCRIIRVGLDAGDWHAAGLALGPDGSRLRVIADGADIGEAEVTLPGAHMALNALMALCAASELDARVEPGLLAGCERVRRRFTVHGSPGGVRVVEDYGHHPAELRATIAAARLGGGRVHVLFQPHRYTRTADCFDAFAGAFDQAHAVCLLPVYAAGEAAIPGADSAAIAAALIARRAGLGETPVGQAADAEAGIAFLAAAARPGDTCLVLGAGDVGRLAPRLVEAIARRASPATSGPCCLV